MTRITLEACGWIIPAGLGFILATLASLAGALR